MIVTAYSLAERYVGISEVGGTQDNPQIEAWLSLDVEFSHADLHDEIPWCSAFVNAIAWQLRCTRSKSLRARSWLNVGVDVISDIGLDVISDPIVGWDVVILKRGSGDQPGRDVIDAPGHVGFYAGEHGFGGTRTVRILGGNQGNSVSVASYDYSRVLGIQRIGP